MAESAKFRQFHEAYGVFDSKFHKLGYTPTDQTFDHSKAASPYFPTVTFNQTFCRYIFLQFCKKAIQSISRLIIRPKFKMALPIFSVASIDGASTNQSFGRPKRTNQITAIFLFDLPVLPFVVASHYAIAKLVFTQLCTANVVNKTEF